MIKPVHLSKGSTVVYHGDLPEGWNREGRVLAVEPHEASGDAIVTIMFDDYGNHVQDIPANLLEFGPEEEQHDCDGS
jgi:hypothetical protein